MNKKKILIIDDNPEFMEVTRMRLVVSGYNVVTATGGQDGLRQARATQPDLILLDLMMPDMDGGDVGQMFQEDPRLRTIPIVYFSALIGSKEAARHNATADLAHVFLSKTASAAELLAVIAKELESRKATSAAVAYKLS